MLPILKYLVQVSLLRASPADAPTTRNILNACLLAYIGSSVFASFGRAPLFQLLITSAGEALVMFMLIRIVLRLSSKLERFSQTAVAYFGANALMQIATTPIIQSAYDKLQVVEGKLTVTDMQPGNGLLYLLISVWSLAIMTNILRLALDITIGRGILMSLSMKIAAFFLAGYFVAIILTVVAMLTGTSPSGT